MKRTHHIGILAVAGLLAVAGCGGGGGDSSRGDGASAFPMTVENCAKQVTVFQRPQRIMTVGNIAANLVYAAGGADRVVARAGPHDGPLSEPTASAIAGARVIEDDDPSVETIIGADVDTVISYGLSNVAGLAEARISSLTVSGACGDSIGSFDHVYEDVDLYGKLLGTQDVATAAVARLEQRVAAVEKTARASAPMTAASVYFFGNTFSTNGNQSIMQAVMKVLGLTNVFGDVDSSFIEGNLEELIKKDPEVIILSYGWIDGMETFDQAMQKLVALPGAADMKAVRANRIIGIPSSQAQNDPTAVDGLEVLANALGRVTR